MESALLILRTGSENKDERLIDLLHQRQGLSNALSKSPYDLILYLERAVVYTNLGYPDLAAGDAYRALLLADEVSDESFEYHEQALESLKRYSLAPPPNVLNFGNLSLDVFPSANGHGPRERQDWQRLVALSSVRAFQVLSISLLLCGCLKSAYKFCGRGLSALPQNRDLLETKEYIEQVARQRLRLETNVGITLNELPDWGLVRREIYPWNMHEPDRTSDESLCHLNGELSRIAPKCIVRALELPVLLEGASSIEDDGFVPTCRQLGLFAKDDIAAGELVLHEYSLLTANNRHKESTCDACGSELPPLKPGTQVISCPKCQDCVFCDEYCYTQAQEEYHPAVCNKEVDSIAKDPDAKDTDESLYLLLLARLLAMAAHRDVHPLEVTHVKYIWGDFVPTMSNDIDLSPNAGPPPDWTLPFSFEYNVEMPLHVLDKMDIDIFTTLDRHDLWVFNTAFSKFRGTASARKNSRDGRPDMAAVHPFWCLANHDCDPNVTWEWGGRMQLYARERSVVDKRPGGIYAGEEILNHYCDVDLPVQQRREWARGSLGGWCMCRRCRQEAALSTRVHGGNSDPGWKK